MKTNNNFHILIVDDEKFNIELAAIYLKEEGYKLSFALNATATFESIMKHDISLILLDINMPKKDGFEVCQMLKEDPKTKDIPVIFLTAQTDIEYISRAFEVGGADYISKPFNGIELKARVKTQLQNLAYLEEIKHKQSKLAQLSIIDPLTKLHNGLYFDSKMKIYQSKEKAFWFVYIKIKGFEKINKLYGFFRANKIIRIFSKILQDAAPSKSIVAKLHGVSFAILLKDYDKATIQKLYETIALEVSKDKEFNGAVEFSTVLYNVQDSSLSIPMLYKNVQMGIDKIEDTYEKFLFL